MNQGPSNSPTVANESGVSVGVVAPIDRNNGNRLVWFPHRPLSLHSRQTRRQTIVQSRSSKYRQSTIHCANKPFRTFATAPGSQFNFFNLIEILSSTPKVLQHFFFFTRKGHSRFMWILCLKTCRSFQLSETNFCLSNLNVAWSN